MFDWLKRKPSIPEGMLQLTAFPVDDDGLPTWNSELEALTSRLGSEFLRPFLFETSPGMCIGCFVAKSELRTPGARLPSARNHDLAKERRVSYDHNRDGARGHGRYRQHYMKAAGNG